ncbi:MAG: hypothetical protein A2521_03640 [Deltaproteobacteria bacterium RIFOXYD12_FULL_57_12]|nr:MAG: hypothetical protein A2521_03640 [Deltaproteobacteria bacterium RIFOXYD12_FULL_57_12]
MKQTAIMDSHPTAGKTAPSRDFCLQLMARYGMLPNIRAHSLLVADIAELITSRLIQTGFDLTPELVVAGALLHDIGKTACLHNGRDHAREGHDICLANDLPVALATIVAEHVVLRDHSPEGTFTEKEIVYYADKRVNHDQVVDLGDRLAYILGRYGRNNPQLLEAIDRNFQLCLALEKKIFSHLPFQPEELAAQVTLFAAQKTTRTKPTNISLAIDSTSC